MKKKIFSFIGNFLFFLFIILIAFSGAFAEAINNRDMKLEIHNPYRINVNIELKCDWKNNAFSYYKKIKIPKKGNIVLNLPKKLRNCQIWPTASVW